VKAGPVIGLVVLLTLIVLGARREEARGTFAAVEGPFLSWLAANAGTPAAVPPLILVLYDEEASELAGANRMAMLDAALFVRAASSLGAVAAGVEGLQEEPRRMLEAGRGMPVFGGYAPENPPGSGWTALRGEPPATWPEMTGLVGRPAAFVRGFLAPPEGTDGGPQEMLLVGRNAERAVPSFLVLAWSASQGWRARDLTVAPGRINGPHGNLIVDSGGAACFLPGAAVSTMTMNDLLVAAEKHEREGGKSPMEGNVLVLARATPDVARVAREGTPPLTPVEWWAQSWTAVRDGLLFIQPGWWFNSLLVFSSLLLAVSPAARTNRTALVALFFALLLFLLAALGLFAGGRVYLPAGPVVIALVAGIFVGRLGRVVGWLGR
jgi:hypothetical protein